MVTLAAWESAAALADAKREVAVYYQRIGFDLQAATARWGVQLERCIYER